MNQPIFSGQYSHTMWDAIRLAETTEELNAALYLVCCRMQQLESELIKLFETAPRIGADEDVPEGVRYIQISDTLARKLLAELQGSVPIHLPQEVPEQTQRAGTAGA